MLTGLERIGDVLARDERTQRESARQALGHNHDVGLDPVSLDGEQHPGASKSALHLVDHQQDSIPIENLSHTTQIPGR